MSEEDAKKPPPIVVSRKALADRGLKTLKLGRGVTAMARSLEAIEHKLVWAEARAELNALVAEAETKHDWPSMTPERLAGVRVSEAAENQALMWMHAVLLAAACIASIDGVVGEDKAPLPASFDTFELLFNDELFESSFKLQTIQVQQIWTDEKNVSGPGPVGSGPTASNGASPAQPQAPGAPAADAPISPNSTRSTSPSPEGDALSAPTPPEPLKASLQERSQTPAAPGAPQA